MAEPPTRPRIALLSDETINRIAAGEVVEGPASVVKELVENSLDAGATRIEVEIEGGGHRLVRVVDDGHGMDEADARLCLERHATSKLRRASDLHAIRSMGFRGEAVPSIAAVSRLTLVTRPVEEDRAVKLVVHGGKLESVEPTAARPGTRFEVRTLFYNTPARRKFQRAPGAELAAIRELMGDLVLAHPEVAFRFSREGEALLVTPGALTLRQALERVLEAGEVEHFGVLEPATHPELPFTVSGYLARPEVTRRNSRGIRLFVNGRPFYAPAMCRAALEAYRNFLPKGRWPAAVLFLEADPRAVDVNVHPAKKEVRFTGFPKLAEWLVTRIREGLTAGARLRSEPMGAPVGEVPRGEPVPGPRVEPLFPAGARPRREAGAPPASGATATPRVAPVAAGDAPTWRREPAPRPEAVQGALALFDPAPYRDLGAARPDLVGEAAVACTLGARADLGARPAGSLFPGGVRILGQVFDSFVLITDEEALYTVDQHVAHERVLFEGFQKAFREGRPEVQNLLVPLELPVREGEEQVLAENLERFERYGFRLRVEAGRALVEALPLFPREWRVEEVLQDMIEGLGELGRADAMHDEIEAMADMMSCKAAIKAGARLSPGEMARLLEQLFACEYPLTCPHGRPILLGTSEAEMRRRFLRSG